MTGSLSIVSYNIWFDTYLATERIISLIVHLHETNSDIICLQEVKQNIYSILINNLCEYGYHYPKYIPGRYGCVIFSKYPIEEGIIKNFSNSSMGRYMVVATINLNYKEKLNVPSLNIIIANTHFESLFYNKNSKKIEQYQTAKKILDVLYKKYRNVIFCADTNILPHEEKEFIATDDDLWYDGWKMKGNKNNKYTFDGDSNIYLKIKKKKYKSRLDRLLYRADSWKLNEFDILKTLKGYLPPSDHFGIYGTFEVI